MKKNTNKDPRIKNNTYIDAWNNALYGIIYTSKTQLNFKIQLIIAVLVAILSLFMDLNKAEFLCLILSVVLVLFAELVNTAIETVVDLFVDVYHPKAKIAKDVAARWSNNYSIKCYRCCLLFVFWKNFSNGNKNIKLIN